VTYIAYRLFEAAMDHVSKNRSIIYNEFIIYRGFERVYFISPTREEQKKYS